MWLWCRTEDLKDHSPASRVDGTSWRFTVKGLAKSIPIYFDSFVFGLARKGIMRARYCFSAAQGGFEGTTVVGLAKVPCTSAEYPVFVARPGSIVLDHPHDLFAN